MSKHGPDEVDIWGRDWARQRRIMLGIEVNSSDRIMPRERLGQIRCTLAQIREEREGAGQHNMKVGPNGHPDQTWPEVYTGISLDIHRAYQVMPPGLKDAMHLHYVWWEVWARHKAKCLGVSPAQYWITVGNMKSFLFGAITAQPRSMATSIASESSR